MTEQDIIDNEKYMIEEGMELAPNVNRKILNQIAFLEEAIEYSLPTEEEKKTLEKDIDYLRTKMVHDAPTRMVISVDVGEEDADKTAVQVFQLNPGTFVTAGIGSGISAMATKKYDYETGTLVDMYPSNPSKPAEKKSTDDYIELSDQETERLEALLEENGNDYGSAMDTILSCRDCKSIEEPLTTIEESKEQAIKTIKNILYGSIIKEDDGALLYIDLTDPNTKRPTTDQMLRAYRIVVRGKDGTEKVIKDRSGNMSVDSVYNPESEKYNPIALLEDFYFPTKE